MYLVVRWSKTVDLPEKMRMSSAVIAIRSALQPAACCDPQPTRIIFRIIRYDIIIDVRKSRYGQSNA